MKRGYSETEGKRGFIAHHSQPTSGQPLCRHTIEGQSRLGGYDEKLLETSTPYKVDLMELSKVR
jgi:hypothetical protein